MTSDLRNRLLIGPLLGAAALACLIADLYWQVHISGVLLVLVGTLFAGAEYVRLVRPAAPGVQQTPIALGIVLLVALAWLPWLGPHLAGAAGMPAWLQNFGPGQTGLLVGLLLALAAGLQLRRHGPQHAVANLGATMLGLIYLGLTAHLLVVLQDAGQGIAITRGTQLFLLMLAAVKCGDIFAYFGGRAFGRHKMSPQTSPGKTWEGFIASLIGSTGGTFAAWGILCACGLPAALDSAWKVAVWGLILGPCGVLGDLIESALKRDVAVKDSAATLPGFGGWLDVFDALLLAAPVALLLARLL